MGEIVKITLHGDEADFIGHRVNLAARLCSVARPAGMVICVDENIVGDANLSHLVLSACKATLKRSRVRRAGGMKGVLGKIVVVTTRDVTL